MKTTDRKYHLAWLLQAAGLFLYCLSITASATAQTGTRYDTTAFPDNQFDTIPVIDTAVEAVDEDYVEDAAADTREVYFLEKEFTGGIPDTIHYRQMPESLMKSLKADKDFWYADEVIKKRRSGNSDDGNVNPVVQSFLWLIIIAGFVTFLIIYLSHSNRVLFRRSKNISDEEVNPATSDIFSISYTAEIKKAADAGNYRLAVRLMFLRLLRDLSDKGTIRYSHDSTNYDYMMQLHGTVLYNDFFQLARHYEYSWYGQFAIDNEKYNLVREAFEKFEQRVNR